MLISYVVKAVLPLTSGGGLSDVLAMDLELVLVVRDLDTSTAPGQVGDVTASLQTLARACKKRQR